MSKNRYIVFLLTLSFLTPAFSQNSRYHYVIQKQETVSGVVYRVTMSPVYTKNGSLEKTQKLNQKNIRDVNLVYPGQKLYLSAGFVEKARQEGRVQVIDEHEVIWASPEDQSAAQPVINPEPETSPSAVDKPDEKVALVEEQSGPENFEIELGHQFNTFSGHNEGTATRAKLMTTRDLSLKLSWKKDWNEQMQSNLTVGLRNLSFASTGGGLSDIGQKEKTGFNVQASLFYKVSEKFVPYVFVGFSQEVFVRELGTPVIRADMVGVPLLGLGTEYWLTQNPDNNWGLEAEMISYFETTKSDYSAKSGYGLHGAGVFRNTSWLNRNLKLGAGYSHKDQGSSQTTQTEYGGFIFLRTGFSLFNSK